MNKYSLFSITTLLIFIVIFFTMFSGVSLGALGKGLLKWLLIVLNIIAICTLGYIILMAYGISES